MKIKIQYIIISLFLLTSCEFNGKKPEPNHTAIFYLPWASDLLQYFEKNIEDLKESIKTNQIENTKIIVCMAKNSRETELYELKYEKGNCVVEHIKEYIDHDFTTKDGLKTMFSEIKNFSPTEKYSLVVSAHGMGWLPIDNKSTRQKSANQPKLHFEYKHKKAITRYFGGTTAAYQTEIETLARAIKASGIKLEFIVFDDCYMSSIEVAYELKDITKHIIASPTEIMAYGFPYLTITQHLIGEINYENVCNEFYKFYSSYEYPYATIGIINCQYIDSIAPIIKQINLESNGKQTETQKNIQSMDGYSPTIFYDFGSYIKNICSDKDLLSEFEEKLQKLVPYKAHTKEFPTATNGYLQTIPINEFSGITTSDPSENPRAIHTKLETPWYKATH